MKPLIFSVMTLTAAALLQGCSYPEPAKVEQNDARPSIGVAGAPKGSLLFVDGLKMGTTKQFNGKNGVLLVEGGKHRVEIKSPDGKTLYTEEVFLSNSTTKVITYNP